MENKKGVNFMKVILTEGAAGWFSGLSRGRSEGTADGQIDRTGYQTDRTAHRPHLILDGYVVINMFAFTQSSVDRREAARRLRQVGRDARVVVVDLVGPTAYGSRLQIVHPVLKVGDDVSLPAALPFAVPMVGWPIGRVLVVVVLGGDLA